MKQVAICMVTYNRADIVEDVLEKWASIIGDDVGDIYIYDSSTNEDTKFVVEKVSSEYSNVFYVRIASEIHSSKKLYNIYQDKSIQDNYKYLWIIPDYFALKKNVVDRMLSLAAGDYDMLMLDFHEHEVVGEKVFDDSNEVFLKYAWSLTQYGIILLSCQTVLKKVDWSYLEKKYLVQQHRNFSHVALYFEAMHVLRDFKFYHITVKGSEIYYSKYRKGSTYLNEYFEIWGQYWPETIFALPQEYTNKEEAIRKLSQYAGHLGIVNLYELRRDGVLVPKVFWQYVKQWEYISCVSKLVFFWSTYAPLKWVEHVAKYGGFIGAINGKKVEHELKKFCKRHKELYLYGAGVYAELYAEFLKKNKIDFQGFLVSALNGQKKDLLNHPVKEFSSIQLTKDTGIIIAVSEKNKEEILHMLYEAGVRDNLFIKKVLVL